MSKSKEPRRDGREHAAPSYTSATGQVVQPTETVKKQIITEPINNKVADEHGGGQIPAGASGESNVSTAGVCTNEESTKTALSTSGITQQPTMTAASTATRQAFSPPTETVEKQYKVDDNVGQIPTGASGESQLHSPPSVSPGSSTVGGSIPSTQVVASYGVSNEESIIVRSSDITLEATTISSAHGAPGEKIQGIGTADVESAAILSPLLGDSRDGEGRQSSTISPNVGKSDSARNIPLSSSTALCEDRNSNTTQQTVSSTELAMKAANVEGASNMVDTNTSSPLVVNDSLELAGGGGHTQPDKSSADSTKPSPSTGTSTGGVSEEQDMEGSGINM